MKSYTDIEQSKKLAEILPKESADMHYNNVSIRGINYVDEYRAELMDYNTAIKVLSKYTINHLFGVIPCWSLAALIDFLSPNITLEHTEGKGWKVESCYFIEKPNSILRDLKSITGFSEDNAVDACYEMIVKLKEEGLI